MSITFAEAMDLKNTRDNTEHTVELLIGMNKKMDKQIKLLEQMVKSIGHTIRGRTGFTLSELLTSWR